MSNLIIKGNFSSFYISQDTYMYDFDFINDQTTSFYWSFSNPYVCLQNGNTDFLYSDPIGITTQYLSLQYSASIQQLINITASGTYVISFYYYIRHNGYHMNPIQISFNNVLIDTIITNPGKGWIKYINA